MRKLAVVIAVMVTVIAAGGIVWAAEDSESLLDGKLRAGENISVDASETVADDLYLFGNSIVVDADVPGDVVAFGGDVTIRGDVGGDVLGGAGTVRIEGDVAGDVRVGAGDININGTVSEDVMVGAGLLDLSADTGGDVVFATGQTTINGTVDGSVVGNTGIYSLNGSVGGTENVTINEQSEFDIEPVRRAAPLRAISRFISIVLVGAALAAWLKRPNRETLDGLRAEPAASFLWGIVAWGGLILGAIGGVLLAIILSLIFGFLTLGQLAGLAVFSGLFFTLTCLLLLFIGTVFVGPAVAGTVIGELILQRRDEFPIWALLLGVAIIVGLSFIPVAGGLIGGLAVLAGLGAIVVMLRRRRSADDQVGNEPALA